VLLVVVDELVGVEARPLHQKGHHCKPSTTDDAC
jgi:hypothetical protein